MSGRFARYGLIAFISVTLAPFGTYAQEPAGEWRGELKTPAGELRIGVTVRAAPSGGYEGSLVSPDQGGSVFALEKISVKDGVLDFAVPRLGGSYQGRWNTTAGAWVGEWRQGAALPLTLTPGKPERRPVVEGLDGDWAGEIPLSNGGRLRLLLRVRTGPDGTVTTMDVPDQLVAASPVRPFTRKGQTVRFAIVTGATFEGALAPDGRSIGGVWAGPGYTGPLTFTSRPVRTAPLRPQQPKPPFPYRSEEVTIDSAPGVKLAGTLTLPQGAGPFPAAVLITGSGPQDRDETIVRHKPFAVIADRLTRDGIAVLRVDDRGYGKSTGEFGKATNDDFAIDAAANVAFLRGRPEIDATRIGLIGHSEGGIVAPRVAARDPRIAFIVLMAAPGVPLSEVLRAQRALLGPGFGQSPAQIQEGQALVDKATAAMRGATDAAQAQTLALQAIKAHGGAFAKNEANAIALATQLSSGWMRDLFDYDPAPSLARVKVPILALNGSKDWQVPADQNLPAIRQATRGNQRVTILELPNLNHLFQTASTGAVGEYADIEETVAPAALEVMSNWIREQTGG